MDNTDGIHAHEKSAKYKWYQWSDRIGLTKVTKIKRKKEGQFVHLINKLFKLAQSVASREREKGQSFG